jgi:enolase-phosphatase E1
MPIRAYLLDIEGTTTPVDFVFKTLFPFAIAEMAAFVERSWNDPTFESDLELLREEQKLETPEETTAYLLSLMDEDRKSRGLKSIQGRIWEEGYHAGKLRGEIYPDVEPAIRRWKAAGASVYIYSSGSVLAQRLIFQSLPQGDLTPLLDGYFDTEIGPKREASSYALIAERIGLHPADILFLSDIVPEIEAARFAGLTTTQILREGLKAGTEPNAATFEGL